MKQARLRARPRSDETRQLMTDIIAGMTDDLLKEKYGLSRKALGLHRAAINYFLGKRRAEAARPKMRIAASQVVLDIRSGMDERMILAKYNLNERQLQRLLRKIIAAGLATPLELAGRLSVTRSQVFEAFAEMEKTVRELD
jgi:uncharacterized protein (DUF433 family)